MNNLPLKTNTTFPLLLPRPIYPQLAQVFCPPIGSSVQTSNIIPTQPHSNTKKRCNINASNQLQKKQRTDMINISSTDSSAQSEIPPYFKNYVDKLPSLHKPNLRIISTDFETNRGYSRNSNHKCVLPGIIDCGYFDLISKRCFSSKVNPGVTYIDQHCSHGITLSTIQNSEFTDSIMKKVCKFLESPIDTTIIVLCHSQTYFDAKLLLYYIQKYNLKIQCKELIFVNTVKMIKNLFHDKLPKTKKGNPSAAIENLYKFLIDKDYKQQHRAIWDALSLVVILEKLFGSYQNTIEGIVHYANQHKNDFQFNFENYTDECLI